MKKQILASIVIFTIVLSTVVSLSASLPVGNDLKSHDVWDPNSLNWVPGQPKGYSEGETAAFRVTIGSTSAPVAANTEYDFYIYLDLDVSASGYGFTDIELWDTTYQQDGTHLTSPPLDSALSTAVDGVQVTDGTIDSVTFDGHITTNPNKGYQVWHVTFTTNADPADEVYVVYGGHIAKPGDAIRSGGTVPAGKGASSISGTFQAKVASEGTGDKTINFMGADISTPVIMVVKSGPEIADVGETITYMFTVTNEGDVALSSVSVVDSVTGTATYQSGDTNGDSKLDTTETWIFTDTWVVGASPDPLTNTATASGTYSGTTVTDTDTHSLDVVPVFTSSGIHVVKSGPASAVVGETVTFTFTVTNSGEVALSSVSVVDSVTGTAAYQSGDTNGNSKLDTTETWIFTDTWVVGASPDPLTNTATASGSDGSKTVTDTDTHSLDVLSSGIQVVKTGAESAVVGEIVTYTFTVTNTGQVALSSVSVVDSVTGTATYQSGDTNGDSKLDTTETWIFTDTWTVAASPDPLDNTATSSGSDGVNTVSDTDTHSLNVLSSGIHVVKSGPDTAVVGETVKYTFTVTNTGQVPLSSVTVVDSVTGTATYQSGDTNRDNKLDITETWIFTDTWVVAASPDPLTNTATASGSDGTSTLTDTDTHSIDVLSAGINVIKSGPASAVVDQTVTFTFTVTNTGQVPLSSVSVVDSVTGTATYQSGDTNGDNKLDMTETWIFMDTWVVAASPDPLENTVTASGSDGTNTLTDTDDHSLDVLNSGIQVVKTGPTSAMVGQTVTFTFTVTNTGQTPLASVKVTDSVTGTAAYQSGDTNGNNKLDTTESWIFTDTWIVGAYPDPLVNIATASGSDGSKTVIDTDTHSLDVIVPEEDDPAGFVYDASTGKAIQGATVTLQVLDGDVWVDVASGSPLLYPVTSVNPQITDENGQYGWFVVAGTYRVHVQADGYADAYSQAVTVPPGVTDLNVGLTPI